MAKKSGKRKPAPPGCGKCRNGYVPVTCAAHDLLTGALVTVEASAYCLCERGQWMHQLWRKKQYAEQAR